MIVLRTLLARVIERYDTNYLQSSYEDQNFNEFFVQQLTRNAPIKKCIIILKCVPFEQLMDFGCKTQQ